MAKATLVLDTRKKTADNLFPLVVRISHKSQAVHISTGIRIGKSQFIDGQIVFHQMAAQLNRIAKAKLSEVELAICNLEVSCKMKVCSASDIKRAVVGEEEDKESKVSYLTEIWNDYMDACKTEKTREVYRYTLSTLERFTPISGITIDSVNITFLKRFENWLTKQGISVNTISIHMRNIRSVINSAIDDGLLSLNSYPFRRYRIKTAQTMKRSLTIDEIRALRDYPCEEHQRKYRDLFMLSFYLAGINMIDLLHLPPTTGRKIEYIRSKTKIPCSIYIPDEAMEIINRYRGVNYLLSPMDSYTNHKDFIHRMNENLQRIGEVIITKERCGRKQCEVKRYKPIFPNLTSYWARHTWATIAAELDIPDAVIDMALVHKSPYPMSDIYIRRNQQKVNEAIKEVIDKIKGAP
jgi:integrase